MKKIFLSILYSPQYNAMTKARQDVGTILESLNFAKIQIRYIYSNINVIRLYRRFMLIFWLVRHIPKNSLFLIQFPTYFGPKVDSLLLAWCQHKGIKTILLIHDIEELRKNLPVNRKNYSSLAKTMNKASFIISHSTQMTNVLQNIGVRTHICELQLFDYLTRFESHPKFSNKIINFAGNLNKSPFILKLAENRNIVLNIFGSKPEFVLPTNIVYRGSFEPTTLTGEFDSGFGLVWDGKQIHEMSGVGIYQKYNIPHKLCMYLAAGIPVIVWSQSAIASIISQYQAGILVDNLDEIDIKLSKISNEDYFHMQSMSRKLGMLLKKGFFLKRVIKQIESSLSEERMEQK